MDIAYAYDWLESRSGSSFNFNELYHKLSMNNIFIDPYDWLYSYNNMISLIGYAFEIIDQNSTELPFELPNSRTFKKAFANNVMNKMNNILSYIKQTLSIEVVDITSFESLTNHVNCLFDLVCICRENDIEYIYKNKLFDTNSEENQDVSIESILQIQSADLTNIHSVISSIIEEYTFDEE